MPALGAQMGIAEKKPVRPAASMRLRRKREGSLWPWGRYDTAAQAPSGETCSRFHRS